MSEHTLKIEFYKPKYDLDVKFDADWGLDLIFTNIKGSFFLSMADSFQGVYFEDEECAFSNGVLRANISLIDLMDSIARGEYRCTDGRTFTKWAKSLCGNVGDSDDVITLHGYNCFDERFWEYFFKEMPKDEIDDFLEFCKSNIELPNLEVDTIENQYDLTHKQIYFYEGNGYPITINDDYTLEQTSRFECDCTDAFAVYEQYSTEDELNESAKSKKSMKESKYVEIVWSNDVSGSEIAKLIVNKFDISVSYFVDEDANFGIRIPSYSYNPKILNFLKKKVNVIHTNLEESVKRNKKSLTERYTWSVDDITDIIRSDENSTKSLMTDCNILDDIYFDIKSNKVNHLSDSRYEKISIAFYNCVQFLKDNYEGKGDMSKDILIDDLTAFFDKVYPYYYNEQYL